MMNFTNFKKFVLKFIKNRDFHPLVILNVTCRLLIAS